MQLRRMMPQQSDMLRYARQNRHPALFAQMRLGKTLPTIRRCKLIKPRGDALRVLVVAPNSALGSWERELELEGETSVAYLQGTREERLAILRENAATWYLINKEGHLVLPEIGGRVPCDACKGQGWTREPHGGKVVHYKRERYDVYIGRGSKWGNPFCIGPGATRADVIKEHEAWLLDQPELLASLEELRGKTLGCYCAPKACHGDTLLRLLERRSPKVACGRCGKRGHLPGEPCPWDAVVLDESPFIKNVRARVTRFFLECFRDVPHRFALTGMPNPEGPLDLWCQIAWLDGGVAFGFKSFWAFRAMMFAPDGRGWDWQPKRGVVARLQRELGRRAFVLSRREAGLDVPKIHETRRVEMPKALRKRYRTAEDEFVLEDLQGKEIKRTIYATTRWHWLRQMCGGYVDGELVWPGKINELVALLKTELADEQVVVWFAYNAELHAATRALLRAKITAQEMCGETLPQVRREMEERFREGRFRIFLIQQKVAEFGMDLGAADTAVFFSRHASLQTNAQSTDRIVRVEKKGVLLIDLVVEDSVDEDVAELVATKAWKTQGLLDEAIAERVRGRAAR